METIRDITALETYLVRHAVLRAGKPIESCQFDGDDLKTTKHFGLYLRQDLIAVVSIYKKNNINFDASMQYQIRGMAVLAAYQNKGYGEKLLLFSEKFLTKKNHGLIWFNARITAAAFYKKLNYNTLDDTFEIEGVGAHYLMFKKI